jgi:hypothetical protein
MPMLIGQASFASGEEFEANAAGKRTAHSSRSGRAVPELDAGRAVRRQGTQAAGARVTRR